MSFTREENDGKTRLKVEGSITIYEAAALREELLACLERDAGLELDLEGVTDCDTAGLQLLYAARKITGEKRLRVACAGPGVLEALQSAGMNPDELIN